jgi:large subunit ribosomal protein L32
MALPARHHTKSRRNKGRAHMALKPLNLVSCLKCNSLILPHSMCPNCGYYKGRQVVDVLAKLDKKERKKREKMLRESENKSEK